MEVIEKDILKIPRNYLLSDKYFEMKTVYSIILVLCISFGAKAQQDWEKVSDSLAMVSRAKSDAVLSYFDTLESPKLLYSVMDKDYYVLFKDEKNKYREYYIVTDSLGKITEIRPLERTKKEYKELSRLNPFNLQKYHSGFITKIPDAEYIRGNPSYFVIKDKNGKRYGEFCLSSFTLPMPIDGKLYGYIVRRLSDQIK